MFGLLTTFHVLIAVFLILAVLLQSARGADLAGAFGGMGSQTAFGPRGTATFLSKATVILAVLFMLTSVTLAIMANRVRGAAAGQSVLEEEPAAPTQPAAPATGTPAAPGVQVQTETTGPGPPPGIQVTAEPVPSPGRQPQPGATPAPANPPAQPPPAAPAP